MGVGGLFNDLVHFRIFVVYTLRCKFLLLLLDVPKVCHISRDISLSAISIAKMPMTG